MTTTNTTARMGKLLRLTPPLPEIASKSHTDIALETIESAREMILAADKAGKPCTHVVVALVAVYRQGNEERLVTQSTSSCDDLSAVGVMHLVSQDIFNG